MAQFEAQSAGHNAKIKVNNGGMKDMPGS